MNLNIRKTILGSKSIPNFFKKIILFYSHPKPSLVFDIEGFNRFTFSKRSHWDFFGKCDKELYGKRIAPDKCTLKSYQNLLTFLFIKEHISPESAILDVGGGDSLILKYFSKSYDCWNIDKLEGMGNGPRSIGRVPYKMVLDYMGNFNSNLPDDYFDLVFSISALEHTPNKTEVFDNIISDIHRVLKPGGYSLHLLDVRFIEDGDMWTNPITQRIFDTVDTINTFIPPETVKDDPDLYYMSESVYNKTWIHITKLSYAEFGRPASLNILWQKPLESF